MNYSVKLLEVLENEYAVILSETINRKKTTIKIKMGQNDKENYEYFKRIIDKKDIYKITSFISFYKGINKVQEL